MDKVVHACKPVSGSSGSRPHRKPAVEDVVVPVEEEEGRLTKHSKGCIHIGRRQVFAPSIVDLRRQK